MMYNLQRKVKFTKHKANINEMKTTPLIKLKIGILIIILTTVRKTIVTITMKTIAKALITRTMMMINYSKQISWMKRSKMK